MLYTSGAAQSNILLAATLHVGLVSTGHTVFQNDSELASKSSLLLLSFPFLLGLLCGWLYLCCNYAVLFAVALKLQRLPGSKRECSDTSIKVHRWIQEEMWRRKGYTVPITLVIRCYSSLRSPPLISKSVLFNLH